MLATYLFSQRLAHRKQDASQAKPDQVYDDKIKTLGASMQIVFDEACKFIRNDSKNMTKEQHDIVLKLNNFQLLLGVTEIIVEDQIRYDIANAANKKPAMTAQKRPKLSIVEKNDMSEEDKFDLPEGLNGDDKKKGTLH